MSTSHRICETCVYCSFAGNCDRYDKPLTSIEQPACDAYDIHPLIAENAKLRELVQNLRRVTPPDVVGVVIGANTDHPSYYKFDKAFRELGIEVDA